MPSLTPWLPLPLLLTALLAPVLPAYGAEAAAGDKPDFLTLKKEMSARLKKELACVEAAKDEPALRECRHRPPRGNGPHEGRPER